MGCDVRLYVVYMKRGGGESSTSVVRGVEKRKCILVSAVREELLVA